MKLRELCVIKVGRVCGMKAETPNPGKQWKREGGREFWKLLSKLDLYIYISRESINQKLERSAFNLIIFKLLDTKKCTFDS